MSVCVALSTQSGTATRVSEEREPLPLPLHVVVTPDIAVFFFGCRKKERQNERERERGRENVLSGWEHCKYGPTGQYHWSPSGAVCLFVTFPPVILPGHLLQRLLGVGGPVQRELRRSPSSSLKNTNVNSGRNEFTLLSNPSFERESSPELDSNRLIRRSGSCQTEPAKQKTR